MAQAVTPLTSSPSLDRPTDGKSATHELQWTIAQGDSEFGLGDFDVVGYGPAEGPLVCVLNHVPSGKMYNVTVLRRS